MNRSAPFDERLAGGRIGPGRLVLIVGPSGAGKDTLIDAARRHFAGNDTIVFPRRVVTRPSSAAEDNAEADAATFDTLVRTGAFAFHWQAHGHGYGIPRALEHQLYEGQTVICNVSRSIIEEARARCAHVIVVEVTAPPDILAARIAGRQRPSDGAAAARIARAEMPHAAPDVVIVNDGSVEVAAERLIDLLASG